MDGFLRLDKMLDWQVANHPLRMSEKARLMALPDDVFWQTGRIQVTDYIILGGKSR